MKQSGSAPGRNCSGGCGRFGGVGCGVAADIGQPPGGPKLFVSDHVHNLLALRANDPVAISEVYAGRGSATRSCATGQTHSPR